MQLESFRELDNQLVSARCRLKNMQGWHWAQEKIPVAEQRVEEIKKARLLAYRYLKREITARVSEPERTILLKYYLYWKTSSEIAESLKISRRHVFRLKRQGVDAYNSAEADKS